MDTDPSLPFEWTGDVGGHVAEAARLPHDATNWVQFATTAADEDRFWRDRPESLRELDYEAESLILVQTGHHSGSRTHEWARVENVSDGFHLHGYHWDPEFGQADASEVGSAITVKHVGEADDEVSVSLTWDADTRRHFTRENGAVDF